MLLRKKTTSLIPVRLGSLLVASGILRPEAMANALMIARQSGRRMGDVLLSQELISQDDLNCALELQQLIKEGSITVEMGSRALKSAHSQRSPLKHALAELGWSDEKTIRTHDLASLLQSSGCVTQELIQQASWNAAKNNLPLGRNLVLCNAITPSLLGAALNGLVLLRDKQIGFESIAKALQICAQKRVTLEEALELKLPVSANHVRIGELLSNAGLLSESDAMIAVENGLLNQQSIGQVLLQSHMITPLVLDAVLKLQKMVEESRMSRQQASELLKQVATRQVQLDDFLTEMSYLKRRVLELIISGGLISDEQISVALGGCPQNETDIISALFSAGMLTQEMFRSSVRCVYAIDDHSMSEADAGQYLREMYGGLPELPLEENLASSEPEVQTAVAGEPEVQTATTAENDPQVVQQFPTIEEDELVQQSA